MAEIEVSQFHIHDFELESNTQHANPFAAQLSASFSHESGQQIEHVPGFYDGERKWIVRFCPTLEGLWRGRTASADSDLDGLDLGPVRCIPNENPAVHGRLVVDPHHSRRFAFEDGTQFVPLGFECDWLFAVHQADPARFRQLVDLIATRGFDYIVTNLYAHTGFAEPTPGWHFAPPKLYLFGGTNEKPDHSRLNIAFLRDFDRMMGSLHEKGMVVHLMIQVQNKHVSWPSRRSQEDDRFWRYVVSRYQAFGNLVWDVGKESYYLQREAGTHDYTLGRISLIRETDAYDHLVTVHDAAGDSAASDSPADVACDFVSDQVHLGGVDLYNHEAIRRFQESGKPYINIEYGYEEGVDAINTYRSETTRPWQDILLWTYAIYLGGAYPCYYYTNAAWDVVKWDPEPPGWQRYRYLADFIEPFDFNKLIPDNEFVDRGFCLAEPGRQYLVFLPEGGDTRIDLTAVSNGQGVAVEWMDVYTGERARRPLKSKTFTTLLANPLADPSSPCVVAVRLAPGA
jgi:hypothetical protein